MRNFPFPCPEKILKMAGDFIHREKENSVEVNKIIDDFMSNKVMHKLISLILTLFPVMYVLAQDPGSDLHNDITLRTFIESESVPQNREVVYHIEMQWPGDLSKYKINEISEPQVVNLTMRGSGSSNRVSIDPAGNPLSIKRVTYYFRPIEMGMAYVEGTTIKYEHTASQNQETLISSRIGIKIIEPLPEPGDKGGGSILLIVIIGVAFSGLVGYFFYRFKKRRQDEAAQAVLPKKETIEERYLRLLEETVHFTSNNLKDNLVDLSRLVTGYFSERYNFPAMNLSTEYLLQVLKEKLSEDVFIRMEDFYRRSDMVKFAGEQISESDFHRLFDIVELTLEKQKELFAEKEE